MKNPQTFEQAVARLEELVASMESGSGDLDMTVASFEEGSRLVAFCNEKLSAVERKVEMLVKGQNGELGAVPFDESLPGGDDR